MTQKKAKPTLTLGRPGDFDTPEGLAAFMKALTGRDPIPEEIAEAFPELAEERDLAPANEPSEDSTRRRR